ncbi:MAG: hypothetical protein Q8R50_02155 [Sediminibacterium sp.]|nr:hypothetical protein [Sediminibacterium sp.]
MDIINRFQILSTVIVSIHKIKTFFINAQHFKLRSIRKRVAIKNVFDTDRLTQKDPTNQPQNYFQIRGFYPLYTLATHIIFTLLPVLILIGCRVTVTAVAGEYVDAKYVSIE